MYHKYFYQLSRFENTCLRGTLKLSMQFWAIKIPLPWNFYEKIMGNYPLDKLSSISLSQFGWLKKLIGNHKIEIFQFLARRRRGRVQDCNYNQLKKAKVYYTLGGVLNIILEYLPWSILISLCKSFHEI